MAAMVRLSEPGSLVMASWISGAVGVDGDLDLLDAELLEADGFLVADHDGVGLELDVEAEGAGVLEDLEAVAAEEGFAAGDDEEEGAAGGEFVEDALDLGGVHLALDVVVEIAVDAALVAAPGDVEVRAEGDAHCGCFLIHLIEQAHGGSSSGAVLRVFVKKL